MLALTIALAPLAAPQFCDIEITNATGEPSGLRLAVSVDGAYLAAGAPHDHSVPGPAGMSEGNVQVFEFDYAARTWLHAATLPSVVTDANATILGGFGATLELEGSQLVAGYADCTIALARQGCVQPFLRDVSGTWRSLGVIVAPSPRAGALFGRSVASHTSRIFIAEEGSSGTAYVYRWGGILGEYVFEDTLQAPLGPTTTFGFSLAALPGHVFVGESSAPTRGDAGAVHRYVATTQSAWQWSETMTPADGTPFDGFGRSLGADGVRLVVGAPGHDLGGVLDAGAAYVFEPGPTGWAEVAKLVPPSPMDSGNFGFSVDVDGDRIAVGAPGENGSAGALHVFEKSSGAWQHVTLHGLSVPSASHRMGASVTLDAEHVAAAGLDPIGGRVLAAPADYGRDVDGNGFADACESIGAPTACPAVPNGTGEVGRILATGSARVADQDLVLACDRLLPHSFGYFITSRVLYFQPAGLPTTFGVLCVGGQVGRFEGHILTADSSGAVTLSVDPAGLPSPTGPVAVQPGETWYFQYWHRDDPALSTRVTAFTETVRVTFE